MFFIQLLIALVSASLFFHKFAIAIFRKDYYEPTKYAAPWSVAITFLILSLFFFATPIVGGILAKPLHAVMPDLDAEYNAKLAQFAANENESAETVQAPEDVVSTSDETKEATALNEEPQTKRESGDDALQIIEREPSDEPEETEIEIAVDAPKTTDEGPNEPIDKSKIATQHPLARLLIRSHQTSRFKLVVALFFISVVLVGPIVEEFVFRVVIQGYFETRAGFGRARYDGAARSPLDAYGARSVTARVIFVCASQAAIFAVLHVGAPESEGHYIPMNTLFEGMVVQIVASLLILCGGIAILRQCGARPGDLGLGEDFSMASAQRKTTSLRIAREWLRGLYLQVYATPIIFAVQNLAGTLFPGMIVAPISIFLFALYEGYVYFKTRSYPTVVGMHMTLNFASFTVLYYSVVLGLF